MNNKEFLVYYCFLDSKGQIESDENGEFIYCGEVNALTRTQAIKCLKENEKFVSKVEILDVMEVL